jgi:hypothetical protein
MNAASATHAATIHGFTLGFQSAPDWPCDGGEISDKNYSCMLVQNAWFEKLLAGEARR